MAGTMIQQQSPLCSGKAASIANSNGATTSWTPEQLKQARMTKVMKMLDEEHAKDARKAVREWRAGQ